MTPQWSSAPVAGGFEDVKYEKWDGIARITINRPEVRNAFRPQTLFELAEGLRRRARRSEGRRGDPHR